MGTKEKKPGKFLSCVFLTLDEFEEVLAELYPNGIEVEVPLDGLIICTQDDCVDAEELHEKLAKYYGVKTVTSVHADDCDTVGIWIAYRQ